MNAVSKVNRGRSCRKVLDLTGRRKAVYAVREQIQIVLQQVHEFLVIRHVPLPLQDLAQPYQLLFFLYLRLLAVGSLLVFPVGGNTVFRHAVHLKGTDLDLERLSVAADQRRMQGLVHICFGHGNIILEAPRNRLIHLMNHTQCRIAVLHCLHNDTHSEEIIDLIQRLMLVLHLLVDTEKMLYTAIDFRIDPRIFNMFTDFIHNTLDIFFTDALTDSDLIHQIIIDIRLQILQRQVIQFDLQFADTKSLGDGAINLQCLLGNPLLALRRLVLQRAHIVQTIRQFDHNDADILRHGEEHLTQILCLHLQLGI